ncbi:MAG: integrase family protein [Myxococcaceae bacterium]|nr:integrase family protein [Myxococcaceae bacterium]
MGIIGDQKPATPSPPGSAPLPEPVPPVLPGTDPLEHAVGKYVRAAKADNSLLAYRKQWAAFAAWCTTRGVCELPAAPETLALYLAASADAELSAATLALAKAAITKEHEKAGHTSPCASPLVKTTWDGIRRRIGVAPKQKQPLDAHDLRRMYAELPAGTAGLRDRALIGLGFAGGFRRSELVALDVSDLSFVSAGLEAVVRRSKTDQHGKGLTKNIARGNDPSTCVVSAVRDWLELAGIGEGPVFRPINRHGRISDKRLSDYAVAVILKRTAKAAGLSVRDLSGHSLRAGFVTESKKHGADDAAIMDQTGHKSLAMVQRYHRRARKWEKPASAKLGL